MMGERWSLDDWEMAMKGRRGERMPAPSKPNKHHAKRITIDGINFPSKVQSRYYLHLKQLQAAGEIEYFLRDVRFDVLGKRAEIDFLVFWWTEGHLSGNALPRIAQIALKHEPIRYLVPRWIDVKGSNNADVMRNFRRNKKQIEVAYPVKIKVVREVKGRWVYDHEG